MSILRFIFDAVTHRIYNLRRKKGSMATSKNAFHSILTLIIITNSPRWGTLKDETASEWQSYKQI
jgi:hypothetical protein